MFAKLYETEVGQVLVKQDEGDSGPEVRFFFKPENLGVCSVALQFSDDDEGWSNADTAFEKVDKEQAFSVASGAIGQIEQAFAADE